MQVEQACHDRPGHPCSNCCHQQQDGRKAGSSTNSKPQALLTLAPLKGNDINTIASNESNAWLWQIERTDKWAGLETM